MGSHSHGFSSNFPAGLRVLVVDRDNVWLNNLENMLKQCRYEVRTCHLAKEAIDMLNDERIKIDIVISDVSMSDMDGFEFLQHVAHNLDLPVIMMSGDEETSKVMKGVRSGACDYLLKPIVTKDVQHIWQHVFRKRTLQQQHQIIGEDDSPVSEIGEDGLVVGKKRKRLVEIISDEGGERVGDSSSSIKKPRVIWTNELHQKFVQALDQIGDNKYGPKKILELMGDTSLTRENVASHLQKHRLNQSREKRAETAELSDTNIYPEQPDVSLPKSTQQNYGNNTIPNYNNINGYVPSKFNVSVRNVHFQIEPPVGPSSMYPHFNQLQNSLLQIQHQHPHHYNPNPGNNDAELLPFAPMRTTKNEQNVGFMNAPDYNNFMKHNPHAMYDSTHFDGQFQRQ